MVKGNYYEPLSWTTSVNTSEPQAIDISKPEQHELTKAQRKNKQRAENRRLRREGLLPPRRDAKGFFDVKCEDCGDSYKSASGKTTICVECRPVLLASRNNTGCFFSSEPLASYAERYPSRVMILRNDVDLVKPMVFRQEKNVKLVGARHLARRFSVSWNTFASTILFASRGSSEWGLDHPICNLHEPALRLIADFAGVQHKAAVAEWLDVKESEISVIQNNRKLAPGAAVEYNSSTYGKWISATVERVHSDGTISMDVRARADPRRVRVLDNGQQQEGWFDDRIFDTDIGRGSMIRCSIGAGIEVRDGSTVALLGITISDDTAAWEGEESSGIQAIGNGVSLTLEDVHIVGGKGLGVFDGATARMIGGSVCGCTRHTLGAGTGWIEEGYGGAVTVTNGSTLSLSQDVIVEKSIRNGIYVNGATVELDPTVTVRGSGHGVFERKAKRLQSPDFTGTKLCPDGDAPFGQNTILMFQSEDGRLQSEEDHEASLYPSLGWSVRHVHKDRASHWCEYFPPGPSPDGLSSCGSEHMEGVPCVFLLTSCEGYIAGGADYYHDTGEILGYCPDRDRSTGGFVGIDQGVVYKGRFQDDFYSV
jgi:hypothetical protein